MAWLNGFTCVPLFLSSDQVHLLPESMLFQGRRGSGLLGSERAPVGP